MQACLKEDGKKISGNAFRRLESLIVSMDEAPQGSTHDFFLSRIATPVIQTLLKTSAQRAASEVESAACLASLIRYFGNPQRTGAPYTFSPAQTPSLPS